MCGFAGVVAISASALDGDGSSALGVLLILAAVACYAVATNLAVPLQQRYGALALILRAELVALALVAVPGVIGLAESSPSLGSLAALLPLGVGATGLACVAFASLLGRGRRDARGAIAIYFVPVVALLLGVTLRGESVGVAGVTGAVLVVLGALLSSRREATGVLEP